MTWDPTWEKVFRERAWGRYPPEELIRFVARHYFKAADRKAVPILEIGCGAGANVWFLAREGFSAYGLDGSPTAIEKARARLAEDRCDAALSVGDALRPGDAFPGTAFDAVLDIGCLVCNRLSDVEAILGELWKVLRPGGRLFSMMPAEGTWGDGLGRQIEPGTYTEIPEGPFAGLGVCHFFSLSEVRGLLSQFSDVQTESSVRTLDGMTRPVRHWVTEARKP
jgi:SAM-dependent methyltransferase